MSKAIKGALLSGLVLPGAGQMALKHYPRGLVFMVATIGGLVVIVVHVTRTAMGILQTVNANPGAVDITQITASVDQAMADISSPVFGAALLLILLVWIVGTVDAYLLGRRIDRQSGTATSDSGGDRM